jgi:hypothetical protein
MMDRVRKPNVSQAVSSLASHSGRPGSRPDLAKWDLWWTEWCWGRFFSEYFSFLCQYLFDQILHPHNHPGQVQ